MKKLSFITSLLAMPVLLVAQGGGLDPADILKPLKDQWTSYSGDMSGKRYSALRQITTQNVKNLSLRWVNNNITTGCGPNGTGQSAVAAPEGGGRDVFVHATALERSSLPPLNEGQSVVMQVVQGRKGPEASTLTNG